MTPRAQPEPGFGVGEHGPRGAAGFERRCRRLLRWYPPQHRRAHAEEMLAVMLAAAQPGQSRPNRRELTDIIMSGIRIRLRHTFGQPSVAWWRDAFALTTVLGTVLLLADALGRASLVLFWLGPHWGIALGAAETGAEVLAAAVSLWAIATRRRRVASIATWALVAVVLAWAGLVLILRLDPSSILDLAYYPPYLALAVATAQIGTTDARRAVEVLGRRRIVVFGAVAGVVATASTPLTLFPQAPTILLSGLSVAALGVAAGRGVRSPAGRRTLVLFAVPGIAYLTYRGYALMLMDGWGIGLGTVLLGVLAFAGSVAVPGRRRLPA